MQCSNTQEIKRWCSQCLAENRNYFNNRQSFQKKIEEHKNNQDYNNKILVELQQQIKDCQKLQKEKMIDVSSNILEYTSSECEKKMQEIIKENFDAYIKMKKLLEKLLFEDVYKELREKNNQDEFYNEIIKNVDAYELLSEYKKIYFNTFWSKGIFHQKFDQVQQQIENIKEWTSAFSEKADEYLKNCKAVIQAKIKTDTEQFSEIIKKQTEQIEKIENRSINFIQGGNVTEIYTLDTKVLLNLHQSHQIQKYIYYYKIQEKIECEYSSFIYQLNNQQEQAILKNYELLPANDDKQQVKGKLKKMFPNIKSVKRKNLKCYSAKVQCQQFVLNPQNKERKVEEVDLLVEVSENNQNDLYSYTILRGNERIEFQDLSKVKALSQNFTKEYQIYYEGALNQFLEKHGYGKLTKLAQIQQSNNNQNPIPFYEGNWENGLMHGKGKLYMEDVQQYVEGEFIKGKMDGKFKVCGEKGEYRIKQDVPSCQIF